MLDAGLAATVNADDPSYFGGYLNDNFIQTAEALNLTQQDLVILAQNSFKGAFLAPEKQQAYLDEINAYVAAWEQV